MNMSDDARRPSWARFRQVYREEHVKVRSERAVDPGYNPYVRRLGWIAGVFLVLAMVGVVASVINGSDPGSIIESPALIIGAVLGVLWLVAKAIVFQVNTRERVDH